MPSFGLTRPVLVVVLVLAGAASAGAQPLGVFRWQQQPYCNVLTINVVQDGAVYQLDGFDDQCGATTRASVVGLAFLNPDGTIGLGLTLVTTPGGTPLHLDATVTLPSASGTWRDSAGGTGLFVLTPGAGIPGSVRPVPRPVFPAGLSAGGTNVTNVATPVAASDAAPKSYVDGVVRAAMLSDRAWPALVNADGSKGTTGPYTSSRLSTGTYSVVFNVTGLGIVATGDAYNFVVTTRCTGTNAAIIGRGTSATDGFLTTFFASVDVTSTAGALTNCGFFMLAQQSDPNLPGSPVPPLSSAANRTGVACTTEAGVTTCVERR